MDEQERTTAPFPAPQSGVAEHPLHTGGCNRVFWVMHRGPWLWSLCPFVWVWVRHARRVFPRPRGCVKRRRLPAWWMSLFVAQVRRHPWWDRPTVHHSPPTNPTASAASPCAATLCTSIHSPSSVPSRSMTNGPTQEMRSPIFGHFSCAATISSSPLHLIASFSLFPAAFHFFLFLRHPRPSIWNGTLVVNESPMFYFFLVSFILFPSHRDKLGTSLLN